MTIRQAQRFVSVLLSAAVVWTVSARGAPSASESAEVRVAFGRDCRSFLMEEIGKARKNILVACFTITDSRVVRILMESCKRGVKVSVKYDAGQAEFEPMQKAVKKLKEGGILCEAIDMPKDRANMHHKFVVIDEDRVLTGSYNFTFSASAVNYENMTLIRSKNIAAAYSKEFDSIKGR